MHRQSNTAESIPESLQINFGSNSNSSGMDQPFYESNILLNSEETPTLADYLLSPNATNLDYLNMTPRGTDGLNIWNSRDHNSSASLANQENHDETKMDNAWNTALSINSGGGPRIAELGCERTSILSLENVDFNLNNTPVDDVRQSFTSSHVSQDVERNAHDGPHREIVEMSMCPFIPEFFEPEHVPLPNSNGSSSSDVGQLLEDNGRSRSSVDSLHLTCKRKNIDVIGESSTSHNTSADLSIASSSKYLPVASSLEGNQSPDFSPMHRGVSSEWYPSSSFSRNAETSQRNCRVRLNPDLQHDISPSQAHSAASSSRLSSIWSPAEPSSVLNPFILSTEQNQPHIQPVPGFARHVHYSSSSSSSGCSSSTVYAQRRLIASSEESNIRILPRNSNANHPTFLTRTTADHLVQGPPNWNPSNSSLSMSGNRASSSSGIIPLPGSIRVPSEMIPVQYTRNLSEVVLGTLFPSGGSESGHQSSLSSSHSGRSASAQEPGQSSRAVRHGHSHPYPRTPVSIDRLRDGVSGLPLSARSRDGRSRMISEIRNALDLMRRGANLRFESGFYGRADLYDRHRDMRLDVDSMSYEELLALEERIGYVNTGLNEDTILKCLRQWKYSPCKLVVASAEQESCCICREDYRVGEDIGTLDCRHDFHAACIKQWLMVKNLCPICKTTALVT